MSYVSSQLDVLVKLSDLLLSRSITMGYFDMLATFSGGTCSLWSCLFGLNEEKTYYLFNFWIHMLIKLPTSFWETFFILHLALFSCCVVSSVVTARIHHISWWADRTLFVQLFPLILWTCSWMVDVRKIWFISSQRLRGLHIDRYI